MKAIIKGNLRGYLCEDCFDNLANTKVLLYKTRPDANVTAAATASSKETFHPVSEREAGSRKELLITTAITNEKGDFELEVSDNLLDQAFDIDFVCGTVPPKPVPPKGKEYQFHITTIYPKWRQSEKEQMVYHWNYSISSKWWCIIRGYFFDAWVICGVLTDCQTGSPLPGVTVKAMDADLVTDDLLGTAVTDMSGHFRIDYTSADFKKTFLSPLINIETDKEFPFFFSSGPDVYFQLELGGNPINFETSADRRKNVGYCLCVRLCVSELDIGDLPIPASFTRLGHSARFKIVDEINPVTGKTMRPGYDNYAFYSSVILVGSLSKKLNGQPMEYMFEYQEVASPGDPILPGGWSPVTPGMIPRTVIGYLWTLTGDPMNPVATEDYFINGNPVIEKTVNFNGNWIQMPQEPNFAPHIDSDILTINTEALMPVVNINVDSMVIGNATVPGVAAHVSNRYFNLRMKQRQVSNPASETVAGTSRPIAIFNARYDRVPKYGSWIPTKVDNQFAVCSMDLQEIILGTGGCGKITNQLTVKFNARNENLGSVGLTLTGPTKPGQSFSFPAIGTSIPEVFSPSVHPVIVPVNSVSELLPCAYTVTLTVTVLLTTGDHIPGPFHDFISFCKV
ncbi:MAG: hypothetical protein JW731_15750 [Bacteroidales bacterium]|nr:hypothetical protein [Bacteroidales bacterium]